MTTEEILSLKPVADKIMSIPGNTKGNSLYTDMQFVLHKEGDEGLERLEEALAVLGYPFSYKNIRGFEWYPEGQAVLGIFVAKNIFNWTDGDLFDMGYAAPSTSLLVKTIARFVSVDMTLRQAPSIWKKHYDFGQFEPLSLDVEGKQLSFRVSEYGFFEYMKEYFDGFFMKIFELIGLSSIEEVEASVCDGEGGNSCLVYKVRWK